MKKTADLYAKAGRCYSLLGKTFLRKSSVADLYQRRAKNERQNAACIRQGINQKILYSGTSAPPVPMPPTSIGMD